MSFQTIQDYAHIIIYHIKLMFTFVYCLMSVLSSRLWFDIPCQQTQKEKNKHGGTVHYGQYDRSLLKNYEIIKVKELI